MELTETRAEPLRHGRAPVHDCQDHEEDERPEARQHARTRVSWRQRRPRQGREIDLDALIEYLATLPQPFTVETAGRITRL